MRRLSDDIVETASPSPQSGVSEGTTKKREEECTDDAMGLGQAE